MPVETVAEKASVVGPMCQGIILCTQAVTYTQTSIANSDRACPRKVADCVMLYVWCTLKLVHART